MDERERGPDIEDDGGELPGADGAYGAPGDESAPDDGATTGGLNPRQEKAIMALLSEPSIARAAKAAGVGERTLHRWLDEAGFVEAYRRARRDAFNQAIALTHRYAVLAVQTLAKVMTDPHAAASSKVAAASAVLRFGREGVELDDIETRIGALEAAHAEAAW